MDGLGTTIAYVSGTVRKRIQGEALDQPYVNPANLEIIAISTSIVFFPFLPFSGVDPKIQPVLTALPPWCPSVQPGGHTP
jgi:hypothetical protein